MGFTRVRKAITWRYRRFVRRQGYVVMTVICAAVIAGSAAWTRQAGFQRLSSPATDDAQSAADLWQQSLRNAATPTPAPTAAPVLWQAPVAACTALQGFDAGQLVPSGIPGLWRVHDAVDLAASDGEPVIAMRDGTVLELASMAEQGICVMIDHGDGVVIEYAGLSEAADLQPGQPVKAGEQIGQAGHAHGLNAPPCLHLRVTQDGQPVDPMTLLTPSQP